MNNMLSKMEFSVEEMQELQDAIETRIDFIQKYLLDKEEEKYTKVINDLKNISLSFDRNIDAIKYCESIQRTSSETETEAKTSSKRKLGRVGMLYRK